MNLRRRYGVTLISLIVTLIVMLILAGVAIRAVVGDNNALTEAKNSKDNQEIAAEVEKIKTLIAQYNLDYDPDADPDSGYSKSLQQYLTEKYGEGSVTTTEDGRLIITDENNRKYLADIEGKVSEVDFKGENIELIKKDNNYEKCYADINGDGVVDGIIYADLLFADSGKWERASADTDYGGNEYSYEKISEKNVKDYIINAKNFNAESINPALKGYGTHDVLTPIGNGTDRFYVMALEDFSTESNNAFYCYLNGAGHMGPIDEKTSNFGSGKENTEKMIEKWNKDDTDKSGYGVKTDPQDVWGNIQNEFKHGWFVPSRQEFVKFAKLYDITSDPAMYGKFGLVGNSGYICSSLKSNSSTATEVWAPYFVNATVSYGSVATPRAVRLSTTF